VLLKDYRGSLGRMQKLADGMPAETSDEPAEAPNRELATFLGRLCGFLEGPAQWNTGEAERSALAGQLDSQLTGARRTNFEKGRRGVLRQFAALDEEHDMAVAAAKAADEKVREKVLGELTVKSADLTAKLNAEKAKLADEKAKSADEKAKPAEARKSAAAAREKAELESSLKQTLKDKDRYEKMVVTGVNAQTTDQQRRAAALATYVPMPVSLDDEKQRVVSLLDGK
jgi:hypothetical protein